MQFCSELRGWRFEECTMSKNWNVVLIVLMLTAAKEAR